MLTHTCRRAAVAATLFMALPLLLGAGPMDAISDQASLVIRLKQPEATIGKVVDLANQLQPGTGNILQAQANAIGLLISNPTLAGVDQKDDWFVAAFAKGEEEPGVLFVIPATDSSAFENAVGDRFEFLKHEKWVLYSDDAETVKLAKARLAGEGKAFTEVFDEQSIETFAKGDLSLCLNVRNLRDVYKDQLDMADEKVDEALQQMSQISQQMSGQTPGVNFGAVFEMYGKLARGFLRGVRDAQLGTAALLVNREGVTIEEYLRVDSDSATDKFLQSHAPSELKLLERMPNGKLAYFGAHGDMQSAAKWGIQLSTSMYEDNEQLKKAFDEITSTFAKVKFGEMVGTFSLGDLKTGALRSVSVAEVTPVDKLRDASRNTLKAMGPLEVPGMKQEYTITPNAEKYGDYSADIMKMKMEFNEQTDPLGVQSKIMDAMYGPEGMTSRIVYLDDKIVQVLGGEKDSVQEVLDALKTGTSPAGGAQTATRQQLLTSANFVVMLDLPNLVLTGFKLVLESGEVPIPVDKKVVDGLKVGPSYLGFSIATEPQGLRARTVIPTQQLQSIAQLGAFAQMLYMQSQLKQQGF